MNATMTEEHDEMLGQSDKDKAVSDTAFHSELMRDAFPRHRYGGAKAAIYAAYRYIAPKVTKEFTERRARSIWEGTARRIDAEESAVLKRAQIEEARREQRELRERLSRLDTALAVVDEAFHCQARAALQSQMGGLRRVDMPGNRGE
jgi:hypothetical protein